MEKLRVEPRVYGATVSSCRIGATPNSTASPRKMAPMAGLIMGLLTKSHHMVDAKKKSGDHQLRLLVYPIIFKVLGSSHVVGLGISGCHQQ